ncbi:hypothetical protein [Arthrobacter sp. YAF16]|uniref:hypothetical protein n=1 Tax=Arthrobacter sp. YAF16 TaxID=3233076 RepID=UPI003F90867E
MPSDTLLDGFLAIASGAMTLEHDRAMLQRGVAGLRAWHETFGARARYVLWDAFGRQVHDRLAGRHIVEKPYRHPVFNYDEIVAALPGLDIIDLSPLLLLPMHEVQRLFIDTSNHPSQIGYRLLNGLIFDDLGALEAYNRAVETSEAELLELARGLTQAAGRRVLLTGRSVWLDTLSQYLGATGAQRLAEAGLILAPLDRVPGQRPPAQMVKDVDLSQCAFAVVSAGGVDLSRQLASAFGTNASRWAGAPAIDWESATEAAIQDRGETPAFTRVDKSLPVRDDAVPPGLDPSHVEFGPGGMPSWTGITGLLRCIVDDGLWRLIPEELWRIESEVLITKSGVAFLAGGSHEPLKHATGELRPSMASLLSFSENVEARASHTEARGIRYAHVVFPDKQSVLVDEFPFEPVVRLGRTYLDHASSDAASHIIYPAADLQSIDGSCMPLDSHLSDTGSWVVLRHMLEAVGVDAPAALTAIERRITKPRRWPGDLGSKLMPQLFQEVLHLDPDWEFTELSSGGGFNDGMIDILFSPDAPVDRTVLLFGDSFFRMMLKHLSGVFTRVICLRTRFYHREMVELIEPDIVFTGNAERYLSRVDSDDEAIAFMLYRQVRGTTEHFEPEFLDAWRSVTSPRTAKSKTYLVDHRVAKEKEVPRLPVGDAEWAMTEAPSGHVGTQAVHSSRARACYDAAPFLSLKHTTYFSVYDHLFSRFVGKAPVIVEVGVLNGGSLYMWREFFGPDARIIGVDLNPEAVWLREEGFEIHIGDQSDPQFWEEFFRQVGDVDIFLDDGGHTYPQQIVTAASALDHIRNEGLLVVEDTHTSYMTEFGGPSNTSFVSWALNLVHGVNHRFSAFVEDHDPELRVWTVQFFESIVAFHVDRPLATVVSQSTMNDGEGRDAQDFRYRSEHTMTDDELRVYFKH